MARSRERVTRATSAHPRALYRAEIAGASRAAYQLRALSGLSVILGVAAAGGVSALWIAGPLDTHTAAAWLAVAVFTGVLGGVAGYVAAFSLRLGASRLELSLITEARAEGRGDPPAPAGDRLSSMG